MEDGETKAYTIDQLAAASRVPSRTIRFYQSKGALGPPVKRGRVAYYGPDHLRRLELIAQLQDRGLQINAIRELVTRIDRGELDVTEWLGLDQQLQAPWTTDQACTVTEAELYELLGTRRVGVLADVVRTKLAIRHGDVYLVRSPALLQVAMRLEGEGVPIEAAADGADIIRRNMARTASELSAYFVAHAVEFRRDGETRDFREVLETLRPTALEAIRLIFGQEIERVLRELGESGKSARLPVGRKKPSS